MSRLNRCGLDAVLVTKFFKREYQLIGNPNNPWNPANPEPYDIIQTNLYDVKTQRKIWSALSETWIKSMDSYVTSSIVGAVLNKLADDKFVK